VFQPRKVLIFILEEGIWKIVFGSVNISYPREELLVSHRAPPPVADRGMFTRYGGYWGNKIPGADQN